VAHTPEQRNRHALCGAKRRHSEETCRLFAGQGTSHPGVGRCKLHGGNTQTHKKHAVKESARKESDKAHAMLAARFGELVPVEPTEALLTILHLSFGHLCWLRSELAHMPSKTTFEGQVFLRMYDDERDRVARISKAALDAGVQERAIKLAERWGEMLGDLLAGIFHELALNARQQAALPGVVSRHLMAIENNPEGVRAPALMPGLTTGHPARKAGRRRAAR